MGSPVFKIEGLRELDAKLLDLGTKKAEEIGRNALHAGGEVMQAAVRQLAPERPALPSGTALPPGALAHDIELHIGRDDHGRLAAIVRPGSFTMYAARLVEYGHRLVSGGYNKILASGRHRGHGKVVGDVPAHPFIRPAFETVRQAAAEVVAKTLGTGIEEAAKR